MDIVTFTDARNNLKAVLDRVVADRLPTVIFRQRGESVVVLAKDEYDALVETNYLMSNPANAQRLLDSIARMKAGEREDTEPVEAITGTKSKLHSSYVAVVLPDQRMLPLRFDEPPLTGQTLVIANEGVFTVRESGWLAKEDSNSIPFVILEEIEGREIAPSGRYEHFF